MLESVRGRTLDYPLVVKKAVEDDAKLKQPEACDLEIVPKVAFRFMFSGPSNSGKTNLARWVLDKYYIKSPGQSFVERIFLFSPTAKLDPVWKDLDAVRPGDRITELANGGKERLAEIFESGLRRTKAMGKENAPHQLVIFDDAIADVKFLNSEAFLKVFVAGRHGNISCMCMTQSYIKIPRSVRMQITALAMFPSRVTEIERLCDEHGPVNMSKNDFISMVKYAITKTETEKYPFFFLDTGQPEEKRFRRCLNEMLIPMEHSGVGLEQELAAAEAAEPAASAAGNRPTSASAQVAAGKKARTNPSGTGPVATQGNPPSPGASRGGKDVSAHRDIAAHKTRLPVPEVKVPPPESGRSTESVKVEAEHGRAKRPLETEDRVQGPPKHRRPWQQHY